MRPFRLGVLVSGEGSNLQAILDSVHGREGVEVACVGASRPDAGALERARDAGVPTGVFAASDHPDRAARDEALAEFLTAHDVDLVVLAGFMELLEPAFVRRFEGSMINVHPSLLPAFRGLRAIERALEYGVRVTGVTVHFVDEGVDTGPILAQEAIELPYAQDIARVEERVHAVEHRLLPEAIRLIARGDVRIEPAEPGSRRRVILEEDASDER
ncbi:MAG TPA: phosphoribosylglycinamide formyltransferase [Thermoleophilaceae bacterium]|nr:phosphoribosylglycinamide formyltransferase [Thermoleophilaceae bacterium]